MKQAKVDKLKREFAGFLSKVRIEATRAEGSLKTLVLTDARRPEDKANVGNLLTFTTGLLASLDAMEKELPALAARLTDPEPAAEKPKAEPATTAKK